MPTYMPTPIQKMPSLCLISQVAEVFTNNPGKLVPIAETISGFQVRKWNELKMIIIMSIHDILANHIFSRRSLLASSITCPRVPSTW